MADMDRMKGKVKEGMGTVQEQAGRAMGDRRTEAEGNERKNEGKLQNAWGKVKDAAEDATDAVKDRVHR